MTEHPWAPEGKGEFAVPSLADGVPSSLLDEFRASNEAAEKLALAARALRLSDIEEIEHEPMDSRLRIPDLKAPSRLVSTADVVAALNDQRAVLAAIVDEARSTQEREAERWSARQAEREADAAIASKRWRLELALLIATVALSAVALMASLR